MSSTVGRLGKRVARHVPRYCVNCRGVQQVLQGAYTYLGFVTQIFNKVMALGKGAKGVAKKGDASSDTSSSQALQSNSAYGDDSPREHTSMVPKPAARR